VFFIGCANIIKIVKQPQGRLLHNPIFFYPFYWFFYLSSALPCLQLAAGKARQKTNRKTNKAGTSFRMPKSSSIVRKYFLL
jgi:hypothetical protein